MGFKEFSEEIKNKANEGFNKVTIEMNGKKRPLGSINKFIETLETMNLLGYTDIEVRDLFIINGENGQVIITDNVPF